MSARRSSGPGPWGPPPAREAVGAVVYRRLREAIRRGGIAPGTRINELELAEAWQISRTPIRDALRRLEAEGLVEAVPGRGAVVPRLAPEDAAELFELLEVLEGLAARRAASRATPVDLAQLNTLIKAYGTALREAEYERAAAVGAEIYRNVARAAQCRRLERAVENIRVPLEGLDGRSPRRGRATKSLRELAKVTAAIRAGDGGRAEAAMREHIASVRADALAALTAES